MFKFVILVACVFASAQAGLLHGGSYAAGPALGAPLLGSVTYNAPETTIVKQQVVVDQHENRYRAVPTVIQTAPIVKHITPVVHAAPVLRTVAAAPALTYSALPAAGLTYSGLPVTSGLAYSGLGYSGLPIASGLTYSGLGAINTIGAGHGFAYGSPAVTNLKK